MMFSFLFFDKKLKNNLRAGEGEAPPRRTNDGQSSNSYQKIHLKTTTRHLTVHYYKKLT